ncbi:MAG TPA: tetratricopeptide repeat protein [Blastocatellia bacterium]|nr:tetratricopeptide repeat protein [Blastocatellia bacterium]
MIKRALTISALLFFTYLSLASTAHAQENIIRGKARNSSGQGMPRVLIELQSGNGLQLDQTVTTNEGDFGFFGLKDSSYIVVASAPDFETAVQRVEFSVRPGPNNPGESRAVELTLMPKSASRALPAGLAFTQEVPKAARAAFDRAIALSKEGKAQESIAALKEATQVFPNYFDAHFALSRELMNASRLDEAIIELEQARKINPKDDRVYQSFAFVLMRQKKYLVAAAVLGEAARLNPSNPQILFMRGNALMEHALTLNRASSKETAAEQDRAFAMAEHDLAKAFDLSDKKLAAVHLQMARLYEKKGEPARAADELERYLKMAPDDKKADSIRSAIKTLRDAASAKKP